MKHQEDEEHEEDKLQDEWRSEEQEEQEERFHVALNMEAGESHLQATLHQEEEEERQEKEQLEERKACGVRDREGIVKEVCEEKRV